MQYHSLKVKNFELCQPCYLDGHFLLTVFSADFVKLMTVSNNVNAHSSDSGDVWMDQEVLHLLEVVEMFDDDWFAIEAYVDTCSIQQCI
jgi:SWI/SNF related-matrix-associated actin-dependent regulator of chromatin subfamily C